MAEPTLRVFPNIQALSQAVAEDLGRQIRQTLEHKNRFSLALAGGNTPRAIHEHVAAQFSKTLSWSRVHLFWGDERYVPHDHPSSNYRMAQESLISRIDISPHNIHGMPTDALDPEDAALAYEATLKEFFKSEPPSFDLMFLGMGADGHTASLFPGTPAVQEQTRWVVPGQAPVAPAVRLTTTIPIILQARAIYFLIAGKDKAETLRSILQDPDAPAKYPTAKIFASAGAKVTCWTDESAYPGSRT